MRLHTQLLLVSLTTLLLPWAGCHYAREMEQALRESQRQALQQQAGVLGQLVQTSELPANLPDAVFYTARRYQPVQVDGYGDDWQSHPVHTLAPGIRLQQALFGERLYLFAQVETPRIQYFNPGLEFDRSDHLRFTTHDGQVQRQWVLFTSGPGQLQAQQWFRQQKSLHPMQDMQVWWQETHDGFNVELSVAAQDLLSHLVLEFYQADASGPAQRVATTLQPERGWGDFWLKPLPALAPLLQAQRNEELDAVVLSPAGWPLSPQQDWVSHPVDIPPPTDPENLLNQGLGRFYRLLIDVLTPSGSQQPWPLAQEELSASQDRFMLDSLQLQHRPQAGWYQLPERQQSALLVSQPLLHEGNLLGYLLLSQTGEALISLTNEALRRVTTLTLGVLVLVILILVLFASSLSWRIRRLNQAAQQAISPDGRVEPFAASRRDDEIGDLSRSYQDLLQRVRGYTDYLETLNGKLAHELRTPLAIVKSSLELAQTQADNGPYLQRAEDGIERLRQILSAMSEASRVEQTIQHSERTRFDLVPLLQDLTRAYGDTYSGHQFYSVITPTSAPLEGSPELMAQLLDKLVDNARSFTPVGGRIGLGLQRHQQRWQLWVRNEGSQLPAGLGQQLFDSLVSRRDGGHKGDAPHLGLGLYIVRLIAEAHGGQVRAANLADGRGVEFSVSLPV
ncbi:MAG: ATP-binding protein [Pseudomonadota bacterium]|nr:ATP-binding protein [Pseudomonadota bacterium]